MIEFNKKLTAAFIRPINSRYRIKGFTLIEIICVIMIVSAIASISYPALLDYYRRRQLSSSALGAASELASARSLSISRLDDKIYGVIFYENGSYRRSAFKRGVKIDKTALENNEITNFIGPAQNLEPGVNIENFNSDAIQNSFTIIFRADGIATADAINFPLPDEIAHITFSSTSLSDKMKLIISKTTGIPTLE